MSLSRLRGSSLVEGSIVVIVFVFWFVDGVVGRFLFFVDCCVGGRFLFVISMGLFVYRLSFRDVALVFRRVGDSRDRYEGSSFYNLVLEVA